MAKQAMTKQELVRVVAKKSGLKMTEIKKVFDAIGDTLVDNALHGVSTRLVGFGNFDLVERAARKGRNPQTGKAMTIPAHRALHFKPGRALREAAQKNL